MPEFIDITGKHFGSLSVVAEGDRYGARNKLKWVCRCSCGKTVQVCGEHLRSGHTTSCGCAKVRTSRQKATKHGGCGTPEYLVWKHMRQRCFNSHNKSYDDYGGRGITVCQRWDCFENFLADMGPRPTAAHTIERVRVNEGYCPDNCVWLPKAEQSRNMRTTILVDVDGMVMTLSDAMKHLRMGWAAVRKNYAWTRNGELQKERRARD